MVDAISPQQLHEAEGTADWRVLGEGASACFRAGGHAFVGGEFDVGATVAPAPTRCAIGT